MQTYAKQIGAGRGSLSMLHLATFHTTCIVAAIDSACWFGSNPEYDLKTVFPDISRIDELVVEYQDVCALGDGKVRCQMEQHVPNNLHNPRNLAAGVAHACVITDDGVFCWGRSDESQTQAPRDLQNPRMLALGTYHSCALTDQGVRCWGRDAGGAATVPSDLGVVKSISAGEGFTCALTEMGIRCWGVNNRGQTDVPSGLSHVEAIFSGAYISCALADSKITCWGRDPWWAPREPFALQNPRAIAVGLGQICALSDAGVQCWGYFPEVPRRVRALYANLTSDLERVRSHVSEERRQFLASFALSPAADRLEAFLYFALRPFFAALNSDWSKAEIEPDLPFITNRYRVRFSLTSLADFPLEDSYLRMAFRVFSEALIAARPLLSDAAEREIVQVLLPALGDKLAQEHLRASDGCEFSLQFSEHRTMLEEMVRIPRLAPFAEMFRDLLVWSSGGCR